MKHIALVGMMGAGKSAVGKLLAEKLGRNVIDTDAMIEAEQNMPITEIFAARGEAAFRKMEMETIASVLNEPPAVIATGGGTFILELARNLIKAKSASFYLRAQPDTLFMRIALTTDSSRPLLAKEDMLGILREMLIMREPIYLLADQTLDTESSSIEEVCEQILRQRQLFE